jgi:hypothetical protein
VTSSRGVKSTLIHYTFLQNISTAAAVALAANAAQLCRAQLRATKNDHPIFSTSYQSLSNASSHELISTLPAVASSAEIPSFLILHAVFSPVLPACACLHLIAKQFNSIGIPSDDFIPYMSRAQLTRVGVPSHLTDGLLTLVRDLHPNLHHSS